MIDILGTNPHAWIGAYLTTTDATGLGALSDLTWYDIPFSGEISTPSKKLITHSTSSNQEEFTIEEEGIYLINVSLSYDAQPYGSIRQLRLMVDTGSGYNFYATHAERETDNAVDSRQVTNWKLLTEGFLFEGDKIKLQFYHDSTTALNVHGQQRESYCRLLKLR